MEQCGQFQGAGYPKESIALGHKCLAKQTREQGIHESRGCAVL